MDSFSVSRLYYATSYDISKGLKTETYQPWVQPIGWFYGRQLIGTGTKAKVGKNKTCIIPKNFIYYLKSENMIDKNQFEKNGYCILSIESSAKLLEFGQGLGRVISSRRNSNDLIDNLSVSVTRTDKSLSSKYKQGSFPFHTDGAYLIRPPRYVVLRSEADIENCPTILSRLLLAEKHISVLKRDMWFVNGGRGKFYSSLIASINNDTFLRYDNDCMRPALSVNYSFYLIEDLIKRSELIEIHWKKNMAIIIDNWKLLHGRADATDNLNRCLQRIWITKK